VQKNYLSGLKEIVIANINIMQDYYDETSQIAKD